MCVSLLLLFLFFVVVVFLFFFGGVGGGVNSVSEVYEQIKWFEVLFDLPSSRSTGKLVGGGGGEEEGFSLSSQQLDFNIMPTTQGHLRTIQLHH